MLLLIPNITTENTAKMVVQLSLDARDVCGTNHNCCAVKMNYSRQQALKLLLFGKMRKLQIRTRKTHWIFAASRQCGGGQVTRSFYKTFLHFLSPRTIETCCWNFKFQPAYIFLQTFTRMGASSSHLLQVVKKVHCIVLVELADKSLLL